MCREPHLKEGLQIMVLKLINLLQVNPQLFNHLPVDMRRLCTAESAPQRLRDTIPISIHKWTGNHRDRTTWASHHSN